VRWEELTSDEFAEAVVECGRVCVTALGVIERHGPHMPLGTDMINGHYICTEAAKREPAIVFSHWFLGRIYEARCFPGAITIPPTMLVELLLRIFDEIGRNGLTKIVARVARGGDNHLMSFPAQAQLDAPRPYQLYVFRCGPAISQRRRARWQAVLTTDGGGHAGESETSIMMAHRPELVKMDAVGERTGRRLGRMDHLRGGLNALRWYADFPEHWAGDARPASAEKGRALAEIQIECLASYIRAVKQDEVTSQLAEEFFRREAELRAPAGG